jgi:tripartite-type tricarboxylate transporter receptor subunit TctC
MRVLLLVLVLFSSVCWAEKSAIYVSNPVGGISDLLARFIARSRSDVVVINLPGVLTQQAPRQAWQNQQPLVVETSTLIIDPIIYGRDRTYDIVSNFPDIIMLGTAPNVFLVNDSNPSRDLAAFRRWAQDSRIDLTYAVSGSMTQIAAAEIMEYLGLSARKIPYRGGINAVQAVMRGEVVFHVGNLVGARAALATGRIRTLIPSDNGFQTRGRYGIAFPNTMSSTVTDSWRRAILDLFKDPETRAELESFGFVVDVISGNQFQTWFKKETVYYQDAIKRFNVSE